MAEAAVGKRIKISKMQQHMMLAVLGASLVFGISVVISIFFIKYIVFYTKVIDAKDQSISNYYKAIESAGICKKTSNGKYSDKDLDKCVPEDIDITEIPGTLRYNVLIGMTENNNLESVARDSLAYCYDKKTGKKLDFTKTYREAKSDSERAAELEKIKACSSLRVVPDALPSQKNDEAVLGSMNKIFLEAGAKMNNLAPVSTSSISPIPGLEVIPVAFTAEGDVANTTRLLETFERSIRSFSFQNATLTWTKHDDDDSKPELKNQPPQLKLSADAYTFYTNQVTASESTEMIYASKDAKTHAANVGLSTGSEQ